MNICTYCHVTIQNWHTFWSFYCENKTSWFRFWRAQSICSPTPTPEESCGGRDSPNCGVTGQLSAQQPSFPESTRVAWEELLVSRVFEKLTVIWMKCLSSVNIWHWAKSLVTSSFFLKVQEILECSHISFVKRVLCCWRFWLGGWHYPPICQLVKSEKKPNHGGILKH